MPRLTLHDLFNTLKEWHAEQTSFVEKYSEHIGILKDATGEIKSQKLSWFNSHKWLIILVVIAAIIFIAPLVMKKNDVCQINLKLGESIGLERCEQNIYKQ